MAFKATTQDKIILRCYECHGETAQLSLTGSLSFGIINYVDCLENEAVNDVITDTKQKCSIKPWKITTLKLQKKAETDR